MPNYYLTRDLKIVAEGDPEAAFVAYREGSEPDDERLESFRSGLSKEVRDIVAGRKKAAESKQIDQDEVEDKAIRGPGRPRRQE
jgi:hypothetical protein